jgi:hypothetical protein
MKKDKKFLDYVKANRKGSREAEIEDETGFKSTHKIHKSSKAYNRKRDNKIDFDE